MKPSITYKSDPEYFESPLVKKVWYVKKDKWVVEDYIKMLEEARNLGALPEEIERLLKDFGIEAEGL